MVSVIHMAIMLDGKSLAKTIEEKIKKRIDLMERKPCLAVFLIGNDPASETYIRLKGKACEEMGIRFEKYLYEADVTEQVLVDKIHELNDRKDVYGILVQLPLPSHINPDPVIAAIDPKKDVDGFHPENSRLLHEGKPCLIPPTPLGIMKLIDQALVKQMNTQQIKSLKAVLICSEIFGHPIHYLLKERGITSEVISKTDPDLATKTKTADIIIVAVGIPEFLTEKMIKPGAIIIDVGTTRVGKKIVGDVNEKSVSLIAGYLSPVPGGVGPLTVAMLMVNVLKAYQMQNYDK